MDEKIYEQIALENGVSVESVKEEMQDAINTAFENPTELAQLIPSEDGESPNPDEFIGFVLNILDDLKKKSEEMDRQLMDSIFGDVMNEPEKIM